MISAAFRCDGDSFIVWQRVWRRPELLFRVECNHDDACPWPDTALLNGGIKLPRLTPVSPRTLAAVARDRLDTYPRTQLPTPLGVKASLQQFFDQEARP
jgi:hypothetical protein